MARKRWRGSMRGGCGIAAACLLVGGCHASTQPSSQASTRKPLVAWPWMSGGQTTRPVIASASTAPTEATAGPALRPAVPPPTRVPAPTATIIPPPAAPAASAAVPATPPPSAMDSHTMVLTAPLAVTPTTAPMTTSSRLKPVASSAVSIPTASATVAVAPSANESANAGVVAHKPFIAVSRWFGAPPSKGPQPSVLLLQHARSDSPVPLSDYGHQPEYDLKSFPLRASLSAAQLVRRLGKPAQLADYASPWYVYRLTGGRELWLHFDEPDEQVLLAADVIGSAEDGYTRNRVFSLYGTP